MSSPLLPDFVPCLTHLSDEVLLHILSYLPLTSLIVARGVCKLWRSLIPGSHIPDYRRRLLELYLRALESPAFHATRKQVLAQLYPFNRNHFIARLPKSIPEDFRCWVLEWPERAVIGILWPGIRHARNPHSDADLIADRGTVMLSVSILNRLSFQPPAPGTITAVMPSRPVEGETGQALLLDDAFVKGWQTSKLLMLRGTFEGADLSGRVYQLGGTKGTLDKPVANSWTDYLTQELEREATWLRERERTC
ncbi:hypothetical protein PHLGIDRAFT_129881 [Phlebiopsis gigantea 11061_1 CR5-6]|uniref:F-box domain-containing protein n=1 Tax=Phlebiopsis gigantea (strain 11061_1 CR5-6) TaxID=745531 RepID=A0A0C3S632_PHLG1|nr:hypothetical protein PHLGIDRAFT_129881 [Phlebiopsis gigantea 11061_1 CR5-6]